MAQETTEAAALEDRIRELTLKILEEEIASAQAKAAEMAGTEAGTSPDKR